MMTMIVMSSLVTQTSAEIPLKMSLLMIRVRRLVIFSTGSVIVSAINSDYGYGSVSTYGEGKRGRWGGGGGGIVCGG